MKSLMQLATVAVLLLQLRPAPADNAITNFMSPIVSYQFLQDFISEALTNDGGISPFVSFQYPENFSSQALTNGGVISPLVSYQFFEWAGDDVLGLQSSPLVSYYYQLLDAPPLLIIPTNRTPIAPEITPTIVLPGPYAQ